MGCWFPENSRYSPDIQSAHTQQSAPNPQSSPVTTFFLLPNTTLYVCVSQTFLMAEATTYYLKGRQLQCLVMNDSL